MSGKALVTMEEAFLFPTHFAGDISAVDGLRFQAFRGADLAQATEARVSRTEALEHLNSPHTAYVMLRDAFTDKLTDDVAERVCPAYRELREEVPSYSLTHHLTIAASLGTLVAFCRGTAGSSAVHSVRFCVTPAHAYMALYNNANVAGVSRWDCVKGNSYCHSVIMDAEEFQAYPNETLTQLLALPGKGFTTACALLSKMNPSAAVPYGPSSEPLSPEDIRDMN
jgi:hypothetical protein